jgi:hypothetical protein
MTLDMSHGQIVLFGGEDANGNLLGDTWVWDGPSPSGTLPVRQFFSAEKAGLMELHLCQIRGYGTGATGWR